MAAVDAGIHVTVSAGNDATDACNSSPANIRYPGATVVGAIQKDTDRLYSKSNFGSCITINA
jgi:cerevisin